MNSNALVSWNVHRLNTDMAVVLVKRLEREVGVNAVLLQEAGVWNQDEFERESGWTMISYEEGQRDVVILLRGSQASWLAWSANCRYGVAAFVLDGDIAGGAGAAELPEVRGAGEGHQQYGTLYVSAHLPDTGMTAKDADLYEEALVEIGRVIRRLPQHYKMGRLVLGMDANTELQGSDMISKHVGSNTTGEELDEHGLLLVEFLQEWELYAANTFEGDASVKEEVAQLGLRTTEGLVTHRLYSTGRLRQIDFVTTGVGTATSTEVLDGFKDLPLHLQHR